MAAQLDRKRMKKVRNFGIFAHIDAGKTTITERILYYTGRSYKIGEVHDGAAVMDWMKQEQERGITITAATTQVTWHDNVLNLIDTPGHVDFTVEVERSLRVLDGVVLVLDAVAGVQPQTETIWRQADRYAVPTICFVNKMDRVGADFDNCLISLEERLGAKPAPLVVPVGAEADFAGVIDLLSGEFVYWEEDDLGATMHRNPAGEEHADLLGRKREELLETLADYDDEIAEIFLEGEWPETEKIVEAVRRETLKGSIVPVLSGTALRNKGIQPLLDAIVQYLPSPVDIPPIVGLHPDTGAEEVRKPEANQPFSALAFKVRQEPGRKLVYARVYSGAFKTGRIYNATKGKLEKPAAILRVHADKKERVEEAVAGDILAFTGLKWTTTGDTLCDQDNPLLLEQIGFATPVISKAVEPARSQDEDKLQEVLERLHEEDPTFRFETNEETGQTLISGMGELHLEVIVKRMEEEYKLEVHQGKPQVVFKESILGSGEAEGLFDRTLGEKKHFARVKVTVKSGERGSGNVIDLAPKLVEEHPQFAVVVRDGVEEALLSGVVDGHEVEDIIVKVTDFTVEENSASEMAFKVATSQAVKAACEKAQPVVLEPYMEIKVSVPDENVGEVIGDLNARKGEVQGVESNKNIAEVSAVAGLQKMFGYSTDLRSLTQGRGNFTMSFWRFDRRQD